ncbi:MAG: hypothetical protein ACKVZ0_06470 [Gemmatimonadales bacterium]
MVTRTLAPLVAALAFLSGCGSGDDAEAKQAALTPAPVTADAVEEPEVTPAPPPAATAAAATVTTPATTPTAVDSAAKPDSAALAASTASASTAPITAEAMPDRESFAYTGGSRDPFASLLKSTRLGPELPDLILVAIYYDTRNPGSSVVVMREKVGGRKYSLKPGDRLGRLRVSSVRPKDVVFTIDDFGTERQETVSLKKQEETQ